MLESTDLFKIDKKGLLEINKIEARATPVFKRILVRSKGVEGDSDGRKKHFAFKELMYIYLVASNKSIYRDLHEEKRKEKAKRKADLPDDWGRG